MKTKRKRCRPTHLRGVVLGKCEVCGKRMMAADYTPNHRPRLIGVCWDCLAMIDKYPARGKR